MTNKQKDIQAILWEDGQAENQKDLQIKRLTKRKPDRQTNRQTGWQKYRHNYRSTLRDRNLKQKRKTRRTNGCKKTNTNILIKHYILF